tara:strand:+ start:262 stop:930 length:669 start_codon:yes stop_codon:yes gene_type:complete
MSNEFDKYYTDPEVVNECITAWKQSVNVKENHIVIETSAGEGAFLDQLAPYNVKAYDIKPEAEGIIQQDFLKLNLENEFGNKKLHFVSNVPFGKSSSLANKFIKHCTEHPTTRSVSFILPASHSRPYLMNKVDKYFHLQHQHYCQDFVEYGSKKKINCCFQVWVRRSYPRELIDRHPTTSLLTFTTKENATHKVGNKAMTGRVFKIGTDTKQKNYHQQVFII